MQRSILAAALLPLVCAMGCGKASTGTAAPHVWTVQGVVTDATTSAPIMGASVELYAGAAGISKTTDANGFYNFTNVAQGTGLVVTIAATGYQTRTLSVNSLYIPTSLLDGGTIGPADLIAANAALDPTATPVVDGGPVTWSVQGTVTDSHTNQPIVGATATLYNGSTTTQSATTDANGVYTFTGLTNIQGLIIDFSKAGYFSNSVTQQPGNYPDSSILLLSVELTAMPVDPTGGFAIQGWVYASAAAANGASVWLWNNTTYTYYKSTTTDATGKFTFTAVPAADYELRVFPFDSDGNGISNYRIFCEELGEIDACTNSSYSTTSDQNSTVGGTCSSNVNLSDIVIQLQEKTHDIQAGSFVRLSTVTANNSSGYPIEGSDLTNGVTGVLQDGGAPIFLQFGSEVDPSSLNVQLVQVDALTGADVGTPIPSTAALDATNVFLTITLTPPAVLNADQDPDSQYQLRFLSLSFLDGTQLFDPTSTSVGTLTFDVQSLSAPLANPVPQLYFANQTDTTLPNHPRTATQVAVDSNTIWLLDANSDFLFGYDPASHWNDTTGFELSWSTIPGAVGFKVYGRNTTLPSGANVSTEQWQQLNANISTTVDPNGQPTVFASGVMRGEFAHFGKVGAGPFSYGNSVEIAVTSVDRNGIESPIDTTKVLPLKDQEFPFLSGAVNDDALTGALTANTEQGNSFTKVMELSFQEDMNTTQNPTLTSLGGNVTVDATNGITDVSWNVTNPPVPVQDSRTVAFNAHLHSRGTCTEVLTSRTIAATNSTIPGDSVISVRDARFFTQSASQTLVFVNQTSIPPAYYQATGVSNIDNALNLITLSSPLTSTGGGLVSQGDLVCSLTASAGNLTTLSTSSATTSAATLADSSPFYMGEQIMIVLPGPDSTRQSMITAVAFNDTTTGQIVADNVIPPSTFTAGSLVLPLPTGADAEYTIRPEVQLSLRADQTTAGANTDLELSPFGGPNVMKGDSLLIDQDGDLDTTNDQAVVTIQNVKSTNTDPTWGQRLRVTVNLPASLLPLLDSSNATIIALGDAFQIGGLQDTSGTNPASALNPRQSIVSGSSIIR